MERREAEEALALVRQVVSKVHDETVLQNWGKVMVIMGLLNLLAWGATQAMLLSGVWRPLPYVILWVAYLLLGLIANLKVRKRMGGTNTYVERHVWGNGLTFYCACLVLVLLDFRFFDPSQAVLVIPAQVAVVGAVSFAFMALVDARYFIYTGVFLVVALLLGWWPDYGYGVMGVVWLGSLTIPGCQYIAERRRLLRTGHHVEAL